MQINEKSLGIKVLAVGVPTVVDAATIANDTMDLLLDDLISKAQNGKEFYNDYFYNVIKNNYINDLEISYKPDSRNFL